MDKVLTTACILVGIALTLLAFPEGITATGVAFIVSGLVVAVINQLAGEERAFLIRLFLVALLVRLIFGLFVHTFKLYEQFGGDALTYDHLGQTLVEIWNGQAITENFWTQRALDMSAPGWGMNYLTGFIYFLVGRNMFAAQVFCAIIGAATAPLVYTCAYQIFNNRRVGKTSALLVALFPAFIIWSSQLMKDGLIIFLLVLAMTMVIQLQHKFSYWAVTLLIFSLFGILSLRFYIFYMAATAVVGAFVVGLGKSPQAIVRNLLALVILGLGLTYLGVLRNAGQDIERYASLEQIQLSRSDLAGRAESGYGADLDVSTTEGALVALPVGFTYLMLAPFPWQVTNMRQALALPEVLLWWASIPLMIVGIWYTIKNRLRQAIPILIFTLMLTLAYSIFQGNVGTAYRQRTQIQVFLFIFIGVGWTIKREKYENQQQIYQMRRRRPLQQPTGLS
jgi:4-amino-4-deoxy-L-arabinose transferase-like glycosyltransferase